MGESKEAESDKEPDDGGWQFIGRSLGLRALDLVFLVPLSAKSTCHLYGHDIMLELLSQVPADICILLRMIGGKRSGQHGLSMTKCDLDEEKLSTDPWAIIPFSQKTYRIKRSTVKGIWTGCQQPWKICKPRNTSTK